LINVARLLLTPCFAVLLVAADNESATGDPFAASHQAIQSQLSAMLEHEHEQPQKVQQTQPVEPERSAQHSAPNGDNEGDVMLFARRFWGGREAELAAALDRLGRLRPTLESILDSEGVPKQLVAVVLVESGAQPLATSPREARGLWQFIPATARQYGLTVSDQRDERVQLELATRAAARYLRDLHTHFGDWPLALAAYNAGQATIESALSKAKATTFWQLSSFGMLPQETRNYVPAVLGAMQLLGMMQPVPPAGPKVRRDNWVYASAAVVN
jgi:Transglycosylase SLT domain